MKMYPRTAKGAVYALARIVAAIYILILVALLFFQERLIFHPAALPANHKFQFSQYKDQSFEERWLTVDSVRIDTLLFHAPAPARGLLLYFHGNAGNLESWGASFEELAHRSHYDVWAVDYPGYGKSEGSISSEKQLHDVATAFWKEARATYGAEKIVIYGRSIGTGIATHLASEQASGGLILESPYLSLMAMAHARYPWAPMALLRYEIHSDQWLPQVKAPILIFHGTSDPVIPYEQGVALSKLVSGVTFVSIEGGHHNDLDLSRVYWEKLLDWLAVRAGS